MRSVEFTFSDLKKFLESRGVIFGEREYITLVRDYVTYPERIVGVGIREYLTEDEVEGKVGVGYGVGKRMYPDVNVLI